MMERDTISSRSTIGGDARVNAAPTDTRLLPEPPLADQTSTRRARPPSLVTVSHLVEFARILWNSRRLQNDVVPVAADVKGSPRDKRRMQLADRVARSEPFLWTRCQGRQNTGEGRLLALSEHLS
jgi:hypothetical protein